eukprot:1471751-Rhodomonas_salina.4
MSVVPYASVGNSIAVRLVVSYAYVNTRIAIKYARHSYPAGSDGITTSSFANKLAAAYNPTSTCWKRHTVKSTLASAS